MNTLFRFVSTRGLLLHMEQRKIAPQHEDRKVMVDRTDVMVVGTRLFDENARPPQNLESVRRIWTIWRTSIKMIIAGAWHHLNLQCPFEKIDEIYDFLEGEDMLGSDTPQRSKGPWERRGLLGSVLQRCSS